MSKAEFQDLDPKPEISNRLLTIPNLLCLIRLTGAFVLIPIALQGHNELFLWVFLGLAATDWLDGKLAILLNQRSVFGARLDSWADAALYAALAFGILVMYNAVLLAEKHWVLIALASYAVSTAAGFWKYGRWPSYHTRAAKTSWRSSSKWARNPVMEGTAARSAPRLRKRACSSAKISCAMDTAASRDGRPVKATRSRSSRL